MRQRAYSLRELGLGEIRRVRWLRKRLLAWFGLNGRSFPWREPERSPYEVVVAEILIQRTAAAGVARAYPALIGRYPSWASLARSSPEDLEAALRPLGLRLVSGEQSLQINWAVLDFAALVCRARRPLCPECPLRSRCRYRAPTLTRSTPTPGASSGSRSADGR